MEKGRSSPALSVFTKAPSAGMQAIGARPAFGNRITVGLTQVGSHRHYDPA